METGSVSFTESGSSSSPNSSSQLNSHKIYFDSFNKPAEPAGSSPSPRRKTRVAATLTIHGIQPPRCQVEGCKVDLSDAKAYHSRHKVCGLHSKSPLVIVGGIEQRFCQQCSRFHLLSEFDQAKRSCRRRLAGHNERRRKTPAASLLSSRFSHLSDNGYGPSFLTAYSSTPTVNLRECYNTDQPHSNCALSLLSNQQLWGSTQGVNYTTTMLLQHQHAPPPSVVNHHHFQGISSIGGSLPPGLGLDLFYADRVSLGSEGRRECSGLEPSRAFNSSTHTMH